MKTEKGSKGENGKLDEPPGNLIQKSQMLPALKTKRSQKLQLTAFVRIVEIINYNSPGETTAQGPLSRRGEIKFLEREAVIAK